MTSARDFARGVNPLHPATTLGRPEKPMYCVVGVDKLGERFRNEHRDLEAAQADFELSKIADQWAQLYTWINGSYGRKRILTEYSQHLNDDGENAYE